MQDSRAHSFFALIIGLALITSGCTASGTTDRSAATPSKDEPSAAAVPAAGAGTPSPAVAVEPDTPPAPELRPENATGAVRGVPAPTNTAPIVAVANYFTELPGIDVAGLSRGQREKFLQRVNSEICSCGCKNDTLARCYVNDPRCPSVKTTVQKVFDEVKSGR